MSLSVFKWPQYCFCAYIFCVLLNGYLVHGRNLRKTFSILNLTIICIKSFTCNNTTFSVFFLNELSFFHKTYSFKHNHWQHLKLVKALIDWMTQQAFISDIPAQMHLSNTLNSIVRYFNLCHLYFQQKNSG